MQKKNYYLESVLDLNASNVWGTEAQELLELWQKDIKEEGFSSSEEKVLNVIRLAFDVYHFDPKDDREVMRYSDGNYVILPCVDKRKGAVAIRKKEIRRITDLSYENIKHITASDLLKLIEGNFGGGWDSISLTIKDIIESAFDISTTTLPASRIHAAGGTLERTPDGFNINEGVGATHTETLPDRVQKAGCDIGIALDGDADRLIMADRRQVYNGDQLLYLIAKDRMNRGVLSGVVGTLMTNFAIEKQFKKLGVPFHRAKVGDRYVLEVMLREGIDLGGEGSGHLIILDKQTTGDGIVSSLQVLSVLARNRSTLESVLSEVALTPQVLINRRYKAGYVWSEDQTLLDAIKAASKELEGKGRVLVRASGTEPLVRVMVECEDIAEAKKHAQALAELIPLEA